MNILVLIYFNLILNVQIKIVEKIKRIYKIDKNRNKNRNKKMKNKNKNIQDLQNNVNKIQKKKENKINKNIKIIMKKKKIIVNGIQK